MSGQEQRAVSMPLQGDRHIRCWKHQAKALGVDELLLVELKELYQRAKLLKRDYRQD